MTERRQTLFAVVRTALVTAVLFAVAQPLGTQRAYALSDCPHTYYVADYAISWECDFFLDYWPDPEPSCNDLDNDGHYPFNNMDAWCDNQCDQWWGMPGNWTACNEVGYYEAEAVCQCYEPM